MSDVFISYAQADRDRVRPLAEALSAKGLKVWWDGALAAGDDYAQVIGKKLSEAKAVVVVWSAASIESKFVRDEAGRARDAGKLVPLRLDAVELPLGFGAVQAEDFTAWNGSAGAPQVALLAEALKARIEGRAVDSGAIAAKRKAARARIQLVSILSVVALVVAIGAGLTYIQSIRRPAAPVVAAPPTQPAEDPFARLLRLVEEGKISGDEAVKLAQLLQTQAFADIPPTQISAEASPVAPAPGASSPVQEAQGEAPPTTVAPSEPGAAPAPARPSILAVQAAKRLDPASQIQVESAAAEFDATARLVFSEATAQLLQDPDPRVRAAVVQVSRPATRNEGMETLWSLAKEGGASAAAIWRACGAMMAATNDPRATTALERARTLNPQDKRVWRMLSVRYLVADKPEAAAGAALVGDALKDAGEGKAQESARTLEAALPKLEAGQSKAFVLGQLGDQAAEEKDFKRAETRYREAVQIHAAQKDTGALAVDAAKLARVQMDQGDPRRACQVLKRAQAEGAAIAETDLKAACEPAQAPAAALPAQRAIVRPVSPTQLNERPVQRATPQ